MEELNQNNYMPKKYFNRNNNNYNKNFLNSSLNHSMRNNNYINSGNNKYKEVLENQIINNNNSNISQDTISLVQIKNDLDSMNNKLNMISETLFNMNFFNSSAKKKINLKKNNSMNNKYINTNKKIPPNIYNTRYNIQDLTMNNFAKTYSYINSDINNKLIKLNNNETYNDINTNCFPKGQYNSFLNNYFSNTCQINKPKRNNKICNIKYKRNNSIVDANSLNNKYTFDDTLNINNFLLENNSIKNISYNNNKINDVKDCFENPFFGLYDQYFFENLSDNNKQKEKNEEYSINNNLNNLDINKITINHENEIKFINNNQNKKVVDNKNEQKMKLIFSNFKNDINGKKIINKNQPELILSHQTNLINKIYNQKNKNKIKYEKTPKKEQTNIINLEIDKIKKNNKKILNKENLIKNKKEIQNKFREEKILVNTEEIKDNKKKKNKILSFHEEDNITIEYNKKDEITKIDVFDFFGENQNFQPRNVNVIIEKLKRKTKKNKSILLNNKNKKNLIEVENKKEIKKMKKSNSGISIRSNKEEMLLNKYKLLKKRKANSNKKNYKNYNIKRRNKLCEKFKNNPQLFYGEELCDLVIKSLNLDGEYLNIKNSKVQNKNKNNNLMHNKENMTDIDVNDEPMDYLQKIIEEPE